MKQWAEVDDTPAKGASEKLPPLQVKLCVRQGGRRPFQKTRKVVLYGARIYRFMFMGLSHTLAGFRSPRREEDLSRSFPARHPSACGPPIRSLRAEGSDPPIPDHAEQVVVGAEGGG